MSKDNLAGLSILALQGLNGKKVFPTLPSTGERGRPQLNGGKRKVKLE